MRGALHRETVARYVQLAENDPRDGPEDTHYAGQNRPNPPTKSGDQNQPNPSVRFARAEIADGYLPGDSPHPRHGDRGGAASKEEGRGLERPGGETSTSRAAL